MAAKGKGAWDPIYDVTDHADLDCVCPLCRKGNDPTGNDHACRVCGRVFHKDCCTQSGNYSEFDISTMDRAFGKIGWSCPECDNIAQSALTPEQLMKICDIFEKFDNNGDGSITMDEYLAACEHALGRYLKPKERIEEIANFKRLDRDSSGEIDFAEFQSHEAIRFISKMEKEELIKFLTPLEKLNARRIFNLLDKNKDGGIDMWEAFSRYGVQGWYTLINRLEEIKHNDQAASLKLPAGYQPARRRSSVVGGHIEVDPSKIRKYDENRDGHVSWPEFLRGEVLNIILGRPNKADNEIIQ